MTGLRRRLLVLVLAVVVLVAALVAFAPRKSEAIFGDFNISLPGNLKCSDVDLFDNWTEYKKDGNLLSGLTVGVPTAVNVNGLTVTVTKQSNWRFDWSTTQSVHAVLVRANNWTRVYSYIPADTSGTSVESLVKFFLIFPIGFHDIASVSFCTAAPVQQQPTTTTAAATTTTSLAPTTTTMAATTTTAAATTTTSVLPTTTTNAPTTTSIGATTTTTTAVVVQQQLATTTTSVAAATTSTTAAGGTATTSTIAAAAPQTSAAQNSTPTSSSAVSAQGKSAPTTAPAAKGSTSTQLPRTGADGALTLAGLLALVAGAVLVLGTRRFRRR